MDETLQQHACQDETCDVDELDEFCKIFKFEHEKYFSRNFLIFSSVFISLEVGCQRTLVVCRATADTNVPLYFHRSVY